MLTSNLFKNIGYQINPLGITKKVKHNKEFQKFLDQFYESLNKGINEHFDYLRNYMEKNNTLFDDLNLIHFVALNYTYLYYEATQSRLTRDKEMSLLKMLLMSLLYNSFMHMEDDLRKYGHGELLQYLHENSFCKVLNNSETKEPCNRLNEIFYRRFLITDPEKAMSVNFDDSEKLSQEQIVENIDYFNAIVSKINNLVDDLISPEIIRADNSCDTFMAEMGSVINLI